MNLKTLILYLKRTINGINNLHDFLIILVVFQLILH